MSAAVSSRGLAVTTLVALLAGNGCSTSMGAGDAGAPAGPPFASGTRLRAHVWDGGDGARVLLHWDDAQIGSTCAFGHASDGRWRCLPPPGDQFAYADAACTHPIALHYTAAMQCGTPSPWVYGTASRSGCETFAAGTVYRVTTAMPGATTYYTNDNSGCTAQSLSQGYSLLDLEAVADEQFVAANFTVESHAGGVGGSVLIADDGARQVISAQDTGRGRECNPIGLVFGNDDARCVGNFAWAMGSFFSDATCSTEVAFDSEGCTPDLAVGWRGDTCGGSNTVAFTLGAPVTGTVYDQFTNGNTCGPSRATTSNAFWSLGGPLPDGFVPELSSLEIGTGRLRARYFGAGDAALLSKGLNEFRDTERNTTCRPTSFGGTLRCLPTDTVYSTVFAYADPQCTQPLIQLAPGTAACSPTRPSFAYLPHREGCVDNATLYDIGADHTGLVYSPSGTACLVIDPQGALFATLGAIADPSVLPTVQEYTE